MDPQLHIKTFNIMIDALFNAGRKDDAKILFAAILDYSLVPDVATYTITMKNLIDR